jgi:hypothetical protein
MTKDFCCYLSKLIKFDVHTYTDKLPLGIFIILVYKFSAFGRQSAVLNNTYLTNSAQHSIRMLLGNSY